MKIALKISTILIVLIGLSNTLLGQKDNVYSNMSLDELLDIDVVITASKKPEDLFETPLSVTILKKEEIQKSGVTSIPEALKLAPGLIVREITPGNYDIQIRGYDDITKNVYVSLPFNTTALVMIDNRIVYSYFSGGTFWETLPVDINDVERIEIVRGPASALYGPNAVTGVINIITCHAKQIGMNASANVVYGSNNAKNVNSSIGYNWKDKTKLSFSGNFTERYRFENTYFDYNTKDYETLDDLSMFVAPIKNENNNSEYTFKEFQEALGAAYDANLSLRKLGGNFFFSHDFSSHCNIDISTGVQQSQSQKTGFLNFVTPLSQTESQSFYLNSRANYKNLFAQVTVNSGHDYSNYKFNSYDFTNIEGTFEYYKQYKAFSFRPGLSYKYLNYNSPLTYNEPFSLNDLNYQLQNSPRKAAIHSGYLLSEWEPTSKLRVIGAVRLDKFDMNKHYFVNYEIASTYRLNKNNLIRYVFSKANKSPFLFDSYLNSTLKINVDYIDEENNATAQIPVKLNINGQDNLRFPTITSQEVCWRAKLGANISIDLELFHSSVKNFVNPNVYRRYSVVQHLDEFGEVDSVLSVNVTGNVLFENYDLTAKQFGAGFTFKFNINEHFSAKLFGTVQKTKIYGRKDIDFETTSIEVDANTPDDILALVVSTKMNPTQWSEDLTPTVFGGFLVTYKTKENWNFSIEGYRCSSQQFASYNYYQLVDDASIEKAKVEMNINSTIILNSKINYHFNKRISANLSVRNLLGERRDYGFADQVDRLILVGVKWKL